MVEENIGPRRIFHNGHDGNREDIHVGRGDYITDGYEAWTVIDGEHLKVFYKLDGNYWVSEEQNKRWGGLW